MYMYVSILYMYSKYLTTAGIFNEISSKLQLYTCVLKILYMYMENHLLYMYIRTLYMYMYIEHHSA